MFDLLFLLPGGSMQFEDPFQKLTAQTKVQLEKALLANVSVVVEYCEHGFPCLVIKEDQYPNGGLRVIHPDRDLKLAEAVKTIHYLMPNFLSAVVKAGYLRLGEWVTLSLDEEDEVVPVLRMDCPIFSEAVIWNIKCEVLELPDFLT